MKLAIFADLHGKLKNRFVSLACLKQVEENAVKEKVDKIVFLGDLLPDKSLIRSELYREIFQFLKQSKFQWIILVGNHDYESTDVCENHTLEPFKELKNVHIVDTFEIHDKDKMVFAPFYKHNEVLIKKLGEVTEGYLFFGHQGINGFSYSSGRPDQGSLKLAHFTRFKRAYLGHIHLPQAQNNVVYIGSPFTQTFGESGEDKHILILDTDTMEEKFIELDLPKHVFVDLKIDSLDNVKNALIGCDRIDYLKILVTGPKEVISKVNKSMFIDVCDNVSVQTQTVDNSEKSVRISENLSYEQMIQTYMNTLVTPLDKEELYNLNKEILEDIINAD